MISFTVPGEPVGKGRPRAFRRGKFIGMYTPKKTAQYEDLVRSRFRSFVGAEVAPIRFFTGAIEISVVAYFAIPKSMTKTLRDLAEQEVLYVTKKSDHDNILKIICDALNGVAYRDDAQVAISRIAKLYSIQPRVEVHISSLGLVFNR